MSSLPDSRPNVLQVLHSLEIGGAERLAFSIARQLSEHYRFSFFCLDRAGAMLDQVRDAGFEARVAQRHGRIDLGLARSLRAFARQQAADVIHAHQYTPFFYSMLSRFGGTRPPLLFTEHGRFHPDSRDARRVLLNRLLLRSRDRVVAVGESVTDALVSYEGISRSRIEVLYNGVALAPFLDRTPARDAAARKTLRQELGLDPDTLLAILVARLDPIKDHLTAIDAVALARRNEPRLHLVLVGDGPSRDDIETHLTAARAGSAVPFVHLLGERQDIPALLHAADLQLLTSVSEGIPLALIEGMAAGLPVAATAVGGVPEVVDHDTSGLLVEVGDATALGQAMDRLVGDPALRRRLGDAGRERARRDFSIETMTDRYSNLYRRLIAESTAQPQIGG